MLHDRPKRFLHRKLKGFGVRISKHSNPINAGRFSKFMLSVSQAVAIDLNVGLALLAPPTFRSRS